MICCEICGEGPVQGVTVYRANEKGIPGIWRCERHLNLIAFKNAICPEIDAIEKALTGKNHNSPWIN